MEVTGELGQDLDSDQQVNIQSVNSDSSPGSHSSSVGSHNVGNNNYNNNVNCIQRASDLIMAVSISADLYKNRIIDLAMESIQELKKKALALQPLWRFDANMNVEILDDFQYIKEFGHVNATLMEIVRMVEVGITSSLPMFDETTTTTHQTSPHNMFPNEQQPDHPQSSSSSSSVSNLQIEASRETAFIGMSPASIVELLMDVKQWSHAFSNIVSRAEMLGLLLSAGVEGHYDGTLQVMTAEFHAATPLIQARETYFARYCRQVDNGLWAVVDVSLENLFHSPLMIKFRRRPSGCLIQEMPNSCSKVTWVEHVEVDNRMVHPIFHELVTSGFVFSAKRWVASLLRHCDKYQAFIATTTPYTVDGVYIGQAGKTSLLKLSERMMRSFCMDISGSTTNLWRPLPIAGAEDIKFLLKNSIDDPGIPRGTTVVFATSICLPVPSNHLFNFLRDDNSRAKWDVLSCDQNVQELAYIVNGVNQANRVSVIQVKARPKSKKAITYLQESYSDPTGSYVVYAPLDMFALSGLLNGENPDFVAILPSGFVIFPADPRQIKHYNADQETGGASILTVAFHIIDNASIEDCMPFESVQTIYRIVTDTVCLIKAAFNIQ